eukprot:scaffold2730_cov247-Pinguiococcus_pyrenoidosus.AAC.14
MSDQNARAPGTCEAQHMHHFRLRAGVERTRGLVREHNWSFPKHRSRNRHPTLRHAGMQPCRRRLC